MRYIFIGHGRLATHLSAYFNSAGLTSLIWSRRSNLDLSNLVKPEDIFCLSTLDSELSSWAIKLLKDFPNNRIVHFSGSQSIPGTLAFHPVMSFSEGTYDFETYKQIPFIGEIGQASLIEVFPGLNNPFSQIEASKKGQYHALIAIAANFPQLLWAEVAHEFQSTLKMDFTLLAPLLKKSLENSLANPASAPTGAIARKDLKTINRHLDSIDRQDLKGIYYSFLALKRDLLFPQSNRHMNEVVNDTN